MILIFFLRSRTPDNECGAKDSAVVNIGGLQELLPIDLSSYSPLLFPLLLLEIFLTCSIVNTFLVGGLTI